MDEAASLPLVALTAWQALVERGALKKGQKSLSKRVLVALGLQKDTLKIRHFTNRWIL
ncbi:hypothetical protein [Pedobacter sp. NJ-S-72]